MSRCVIFTAYSYSTDADGDGDQGVDLYGSFMNVDDAKKCIKENILDRKVIFAEDIEEDDTDNKYHHLNIKKEVDDLSFEGELTKQGRSISIEEDQVMWVITRSFLD